MSGEGDEVSDVHCRHLPTPTSGATNITRAETAAMYNVNYFES